MSPFQRIFGTGPRGTGLSLAMLAATWGLVDVVGLPAVHGHSGFGLMALLVSVVLTVAGAVWSLKSLPVDSRGRELVTQGAFRYARHPLYASFLLSFDFGLALYLDNWIYVFWALLLLPVWHANVAGEERLMCDVFGDAYKNYCKRTGRFWPMP